MKTYEIYYDDVDNSLHTRMKGLSFETFIAISDKCRFQIMLILYCRFIANRAEVKLLELVELTKCDLFDITHNIDLLKTSELLITNGDYASISLKGLKVMNTEFGFRARKSKKCSAKTFRRMINEVPLANWERFVKANMP
jgi:hypothetical protein